jgi:hypothetical protein
MMPAQLHHLDTHQLAPSQMVLVAARGGTAACCMFGQTGSGKTYTMSAELQAVTGMLFPAAAAGASDNDTGTPQRSVQRLQQLLTGCSIQLACYEVRGAEHAYCMPCSCLMRASIAGAALQRASAIQPKLWHAGVWQELPRLAAW